MASKPRAGLGERLRGYDSFERHHALGTLVGRGFGGTILDAGGLSGGLNRFVPAARVTALNLDATGDVIYGGGIFPFANGAFDAVASLDTLEHLPRERREIFVRECIRVAAAAVLVAAPYGTSGHIEYEARLDQLYCEVHGGFHRWLHEHVIHGLPDDAEINGYCHLLTGEGFAVSIYYCGDYVEQCGGLEHALQRARTLGPFRGLGVALDLIAGVTGWRQPVLTETASERANRFYVFGERQRAAAAPLAGTGDRR